MADHDSSHYATIFSYLQDKIIFENFTCNEKHQLIHNASHFTLISSDLYKNGLDKTLLRCLEIEELEKVLAEFHNGICGSHSNGLTLA